MYGTPLTSSTIVIIGIPVTYVRLLVSGGGSRSGASCSMRLGCTHSKQKSLSILFLLVFHAAAVEVASAALCASAAHYITPQPAAAKQTSLREGELALVCLRLCVCACVSALSGIITVYCNTLQRTVSHCNTLHNTALHRNTWKFAATQKRACL